MSRISESIPDGSMERRDGLWTIPTHFIIAFSHGAHSFVAIFPIQPGQGVFAGESLSRVPEADSLLRDCRRWTNREYGISDMIFLRSRAL